MTCKGTCHLISINASPNLGSMFARGFKKCSVCEKWFETNDYTCVCCHRKLSTKPKNGRMGKDAFARYMKR